MKKSRTFTKRDLRFLPIGFQFFHEIDKDDLKKYKQPHFIRIDAYQTSFYQPRKCYKPISRLIKYEN